MGNKATTPILTIQEIAEIASETGFAPSQIERLYDRFCSLDKGDKGFLEHKDFMAVSEIRRNPFGERIVQIFMSESKKDQIEFFDFAKSMARFLPINKYTHEGELNSRDEKLRFLFKVYDLDDEDRISQNQLIAVLLLMLGETLESDKAKEMAEKIFEELGVTEGFITVAQFQKALEKTDFEQRMSVRFLH